MTNAKILVVEDEGVVARDIQSTLTSLGYDVPAIAFSGEEAVRKAEEIQPDLVLMDIVLRTDPDGVEAARQIRDRFDVPVVYLTAYADEETLQRALATGAFGYVVKPFSERQLRAAIETALRKRETERKLTESGQKYKELAVALVLLDD